MHVIHACMATRSLCKVPHSNPSSTNIQIPTNPHRRGTCTKELGSNLNRAGAVSHMGTIHASFTLSSITFPKSHWQQAFSVVKELFCSLNADPGWEFSKSNKPNNTSGLSEDPSNNYGLERVQSDLLCSRTGILCHISISILKSLILTDC